MESYQTAGVIIGIIGTILGLFVLGFAPAPIGFVGIPMALFSFIGIFLPLLKTSKSKAVGIYYIVVGIPFNLLLLIPGIMALRYKPQFVNNQIIK